MTTNEQWAKNLRFFREKYRQKYKLDIISLRAFARAIGVSYDTYIRWERKGWVPYRSNIDLMVRFLRQEFPSLINITAGSLLNSDLTKESVNIERDKAPPRLPEGAVAIPVYSLKDIIPSTPREYYFFHRKLVKHTDFIITITDNTLKQFDIFKNDILEFQEGATSKKGTFLVRINDKNRLGTIKLTTENVPYFLLNDVNLNEVLIELPENTKIIGQLLRITRQIVK